MAQEEIRLGQAYGTLGLEASTGRTKSKLTLYREPFGCLSILVSSTSCHST
ncbi:hypothetical protein F442_02540 [Phytophthora nicotianae P10297]|uniref:Uncharacterized protein n=1 Tax=Phytophthora nicotianae P10297 TaxID=1317064 RepID=W2ZYT5_PHYNI|nr:hypothetical protein F442_02540 [Phytophthora nicotianae P10297]